MPETEVASLINLLLDIATTAAILFAVAAGLLIVYGVLKIINFAHGAFLTIGGYSALVVTQLGLDPWLAVPLALLAGAALGAVVEAVIVRPLYRRPLDAILATWGLGIVAGPADHARASAAGPTSCRARWRAPSPCSARPTRSTA